MVEETVEPKPSRLKTTLGLESLKELGTTLKTISDVKEQLEEAKKTLGELAKENSPTGRALAQLIEAQGLKILNQDNVTALEGVKTKMEEEVKAKNEEVEQLRARNAELEESRVVHEVTERVTSELDKRLPRGNSVSGNGGENRLVSAIERAIAERIEKLIGGSAESQLTSEQIRSIVREEVGKSASSAEKPEDLVDRIVGALTMGDKLREKLGMSGVTGRYLPVASGEGSLRTDLVKVLLEDERERLKIQNDREVSDARNKHIGTLVGTFRENAEDIIGATRDLTHLIEEDRQKKGQGRGEGERGWSFKCSNCGETFTLEGEPESDFPCPGCQTNLQVKRPEQQLPKIASSLEI